MGRGVNVCREEEEEAVLGLVGDRIGATFTGACALAGIVRNRPCLAIEGSKRGMAW